MPSEPVLRLVDRLRGRYVLAVDMSIGPLDGRDTFTRQFPTTPLKCEAADIIETLETGGAVDRNLTDFISELCVPTDPLNCGKFFTPPIHREAIRRIILLSEGYPDCDGQQCTACQDDPTCHFLKDPQ